MQPCKRLVGKSCMSRTSAEKDWRTRLGSGPGARQRGVSPGTQRDLGDDCGRVVHPKYVRQSLLPRRPFGAAGAVTSGAAFGEDTSDGENASARSGQHGAAPRAVICWQRPQRSSDKASWTAARRTSLQGTRPVRRRTRQKVHDCRFGSDTLVNTNSSLTFCFFVVFLVCCVGCFCLVCLVWFFVVFVCW